MKFDIKEYSRKRKLKGLASQAQILIETKGKIRLITKPTRTISGVAPVAIMTKFIACPHGRCIMCPTVSEIPQSYTGKEPATRRALRNKFNAYLQVFNRLEQYTLLGHTPEKVELIIMGGNFTSFPLRYQNCFIRGAFQAINDFSRLSFGRFLKVFELRKPKSDAQRLKQVERNILGLQRKTTLRDEIRKNETAKLRCVALAIETRPDYCRQEQINRMLSQGTTRVELGVQTIYNQILRKIHRGHSVEDSIKATQLLKDSFLKVGYHWMPGLPGSNLKMDLLAFKKIFEDQSFRPDALKIYPCMVLKDTELYELWKQRKFKPLSTETAKKLITNFKKYIPEYCRVMRIQRDIPTYMTEAGVDVTNLRQIIQEHMHKKGLKCRCIRCREPREKQVDLGRAKIVRRDYKASNGQEIFLSYEADDVLLGFLRLRIPYKPFRPEITKDSAGVRELHVYGQLISLNQKGKIQHKGIGKKLLCEAEKIAKNEFKKNKMLVIAGVGARQYFRKLGYKQDGSYVSKRL